MIFKKGEVAEWLKAHAWKACILLKVSRVRIPFSPPKIEMNNLLKIIIFNTSIFLFLLILTDLFFGSWFTNKNFGSTIREQRNIKKFFVADVNGKKIKYVFERNELGFIGKNLDPKSIKIVFEGGSTGEQMYTPPQYRIVDLLNSYFAKEGFSFNIINASKGGKTTRGYVNDFANWFPKINNFNPQIVIFYIGINDSVLDFPDHFDKIEKDQLSEKVEDYLKNNSFFYKLKVDLQNTFNPRMRLAYDITKVKNDLYKNYKYINYYEASSIHTNLDASPQEINLLNNFKNNLDNLNFFIKKNKIIPIFITQIRYDGLASKNLFLINEFLKKFCALNNYNVIKVDELVEVMDKFDFYDEMHTTVNGSIKLAKIIYPELKENFKKIMILKDH